MHSRHGAMQVMLLPRLHEPGLPRVDGPRACRRDRVRGAGSAWLAPAGRMALTNYLLQSLVGTLVFYGYGLGLWGQVPRRWQVLGVLVVFALQVLAQPLVAGALPLRPGGMAVAGLHVWALSDARRDAAATAATIEPL